jgi:uncharacterized spore protein YtfJ
MATLQQIFSTISERLESVANVRTVFGEPVSAQGRTVIPVGKVRYGFGGGEGNRKFSGADQPDAGGGGGGGVVVAPVGVIEITSTGTRFVPTADYKRMVAAFSAGLVAGALLLSRRKSHLLR